MNAPKQVICMKWGTLYGPEYVNRLYTTVRNNTTGPLRFVCLTDNREGIDQRVECLDCPEIDLPMPERMTGWRKICVYRKSESMYGLEGQWLYLDLDVVVTGSVDEFFTYMPDKSFIVMKNWTQPGSNIGNTSVYRFEIGTDEYLYDYIVENYKNVFANYSNEQKYISDAVKDLNFWPDDWCVLFKTHCVPAWPIRFWKEPTLPNTARIVAFPGDPNPHDAVEGRWPVKKAYKRLYKYIKPARWIREIWDAAEQNTKNMS